MNATKLRYLAARRHKGNNLPIKLAATGEKLDDLEDFDPRAFVDALFA